MLKKLFSRKYKNIDHKRKLTKWQLVKFSIFAMLPILGIVAVARLFFVPETGAWYATGGTWPYRKRILVDDTKVSGTADLTNFPMLVSLNDQQLAKYAQADGDDILFTDADGTKLDHEIEYWDSGSGKLVAWVEATLDGDEDTAIYMYYGDQTVSTQQSQNGVWGGYLGTWHLGETAADEETISALHIDSTSTGADGTQTNNDDALTQMGIGQDFDDTTDYITMGNIATFDAGGTDDLVLSGWFHRDTSNTDDTIVANRNGVAAGDTGYILYIDDATDQLILSLSDGTNTYSIASATTFASTASTGAGWYHFVAVWDQDSAANSEIYINGVDDNATDTASSTIGNVGSLDGGVDFQIGSESDEGNTFDGRLDEIRVTKTIFTSTTDYIITEFNNQQSPANFYTVEQQETQDHINPPVMYLKFNEGRSDSCPISGADACDTTVNKNEGTVSAGAPTWQNEDLCISGKCLNFDGVDDTISVANSQTIDLNNPGDSGVTFATWVKVNSDGGSDSGQIFEKGGSTYCQTTNEGGGVVDLACSFDLATTPATATVTDGLILNRWHHIELVYDGGTTITIYIDGKSRAVSTNGVGSPDADANALTIGGGTNDFDGFIDEFKFFDFALTDAQAVTIANRGEGIGGNTAVLGAASTAYLNQGLVGYWKLDETAANSCTGGSNDSCDSSGNGRDGAWTGDATAIPSAKFGAGISLDGTGDYISVADNDVFDFTTSMSVSAWVNSDDTADFQRVVAKMGAGEATGFMLDQTSSGTIRLRLNSTECTSTSAITTNRWYHAAGTYDGTNMRVYIDGTLENTCAFSSSITANTEIVAIGNRSDNNSPWDGEIDSVRVYNRGLNTMEIAQLYTWAPGPVAYWKFDENKDNTCTGGTNDVCDSSLNVNDGAKTSMPTYNWISGKYGSALDFDGSNDYIEGPTSASLLAASGESLTITSWFKVDTADAIHIFLANGFTSTTGYFLRANTFTNTIQGKIEDTAGDVNCNNGDGLQSSATFTVGTWNHAAFTWDDATGVTNIYLNGQHSGTCTDADIDDTSAADFVRIGQASGDFLNGTVDDMRVYNYARSHTQIIQDMNASHPVTASPVVHWKFDEGTDTTAFNSFDVGPDGTLSNIASPATSTSGWTASGKYNRGIIFDGSNDAVTLATASDATVDFNSSQPFSICAWNFITTMPGSSEGDLIVGKWDTTSTLRGYRLYVTNDDADTTGNFRAEIYDESADQTISAAGATDSISTNTWYHTCLTFNGGVAGAANDLRLYVNGRNVASNSANTSFLGLEDIAVDFTVGDYDTTDAVAANTAFTGTIDEVQVYSGLLTKEDILVAYNANASTNFGGGSSESATLTDGTGNPAVLLWDLNENTGTTANDTTGNANDGTLTNTPTWRPGKMGSGVNFAGSNQHITIADDADLDFGAAGSFSIQTWFKHGTASATETLVAKLEGTGTDGGYKIKMESDGDLTCEIDDDDADTTIDDTISSTLATYDDNNWHHVACVKSGSSTLSLYIDGMFITSDTSITADSLANDDALFYGIDISAGTEDWIGQLDHLIIHNYARSQAQVAYDYNRGTPLAHWKQDEIGVTSQTITHDATTSGTGSGTSVTFSHTVANQNNRILLVWVGSEDTNAGHQVVNSVTYNGDNLTQAASEDEGSTSINRLDLWYLLNPDTGTNDVIMSFAGSTDGSGGYASSYYNVAQQAPQDVGLSTTTATTTTVNIATKTRNSLIVDSAIDGASGDAFTPGTGQTEISDTTIAGGFKMATSYKYETSITPTTMSQQGLAGSNAQVQIATVLAPVTSTDKIQDSSGNGFTGTMTNMESSTDLVEAKYNKGLDYDGADEYVSVSDNVQLRFDEATRDFSLFAWVKRDANGEMNVMSKEDADDDGWRLQFTSSNIVRCSVDAIDIDSSSTITDTSWHHIGCTIDRDGNGQVYIDGKANGTATAISSEAMANTSSLTIGTRSYTSTNYVNGIIDDIQIYNYAVSATQIKNIMNQGAIRFGPQTGTP